MTDLLDRSKSDQEHRYTSTGIKWWRHEDQMKNYLHESGHSVVSTHISPEGGCNLTCPYCSVTYRDTHSRIDIDVILDYVDKLISRGLKAVILTGGGEPTSYPYINDLVSELHYSRDLKVALITNGTLTHNLNSLSWAAFDWVRVSVNLFSGWKKAIRLPVSKLRSDCTVGLSIVYTGSHQDTRQLRSGWIEVFKDISSLADRLSATYIRVLPNCLAPQDKLFKSHVNLDLLLKELDDERIFHQVKFHKTPDTDICHQSFFRPYLSEEPNPWDGEPGTVFPCDSVVLNSPTPNQPGYGKFMEKFSLCKPADVLEFLDGNIPSKFTPRKDCSGCVFTSNVEMLGEWKKTGEGIFPSIPLDHEDFI